MVNILAYDIGTTSVKVCLFRVDETTGKTTIEMTGSASERYQLYTLPDGGAEQHMDEWWEAMCRSTRQLMAEVPVGTIDGISFCSQMQGLALVDENGELVRHPMSYMDQRATVEMQRGIGTGFKVAGMNARKLLTSLKITGAVSGSVKDPMWKYLWVKTREPENFRRVRWWLDVKESLIARMTGACVMTEDSACATLLYDTRDGQRGWSRRLTEMFGVEHRHLPNIIRTTDVAGYLRETQAAELGLEPGIPVFGGGGDASLIGIGAGCVRSGDTHIYCGTSGWVSTITEKQVVDTGAMIASIVGALEGRYNYFAEMETAGKSLEWVKDHLALDEVGIYLQKQDVTGKRSSADGSEEDQGSDPNDMRDQSAILQAATTDPAEKLYRNLFDYLSEVIDSAAPGAGGVLFTPWLHGNRCPFEDPKATGMFFGLTLDTGKTEMIRAVVEGICYHLRWMLECQDRKVRTSQTIRFCGGVARSPVFAQILADITGRIIEVVDSPQNVGSVGAALTAAVGLDIIHRMEDIAEVIPVHEVYHPRKQDVDVYQRNYDVFRQIHRANKKLFAAMG